MTTEIFSTGHISLYNLTYSQIKEIQEAVYRYSKLNPVKTKQQQKDNNELNSVLDELCKIWGKLSVSGQIKE